MNWLQKLFHIHRWIQIYSYASMKDAFGHPRDRSGTLTIGEECEFCDKSRNKILVYDKSGKVEKEYTH
jgi:hypothetical protein